MNVSNSRSFEAAAISTGTRACDLFVEIDVVPVALPRDDLQIVRRADRVGQAEARRSGDAQVGFQLLLREPIEAARGSPVRAIAKHVAKESFQKAHRRLGCSGEFSRWAGPIIGGNRREKQRAG